MIDNKYFLNIAVPTPLRRLFAYLPTDEIDPQTLKPGIRILVPFQSRTLVGILVSVTKESSIPVKKLKKILKVMDEEPIFPKDVYQLCIWAADYYHYSLGEVFKSALPVSLRKEKLPNSRENKNVLVQKNHPEFPLELNPAQQHAIAEILKHENQFHVFLLNGVTGSGKTEVYLRVITEILQKNKQVLVLVPEISLTPQTIDRFRKRFPDFSIVAMHSNLTEKDRFDAWLRIQSGDAHIVIGTRLSIFAPFAALGMIIIDEEHDTSFKQQDRFRYHARDVAIMRAHINQIPILLGSATPSLESLLNVKRDRYTSLSLPDRAGLATLPQFQMIDLKQKTVEEGLTKDLLHAMESHLNQGNQVLLFLNRRGFAPVFYCQSCAWIATCRRCDMRLVYHHSPLHLQCHQCDLKTEIPKRCVKCGETQLKPIGLGTQKLEQTLGKHFPDVPIIRVDRDNTRRKGALDKLLEEINTEQKAILLGTQMLAKGHHFPNVTMVGIVNADLGLFSTDFRASEQMGQLLLQVAGRAGRAEKKGTVILQTHHPDHPLLQTLIQQGYQHFSELLLSERKEALLPPFIYSAVFKAESYIEDSAKSFLQKIKSFCGEDSAAIKIFGPVPALLAKRKGLFCQHLFIKAESRNVLQPLLRDLVQKIEAMEIKHPVKWILDVDPREV